MNYCLYAEPEWIKSCYGLNPHIQGAIHYDMMPRIFHSGLTNWAMVFEGSYNVPSKLEEYEFYDVIHVNLTPHGVGSLKRIRSDIERLKTKKKPVVVANVDHAINMWEGFANFEWFLHDLSLADHLFCVHPVMSRTLNLYLDKHVHTIPHPTNLEQFSELRVDEKFDIPTVVVFVHSYDVNTLIVSEALKALKRKYKFQTLAIGNAERRKEYVKWNFDQYISGLPFYMFAKVVGMCNVAVDTAITHSYGRVGVESAALGIPCIGNNSVESVRCLWPELIVDIFDAKQIAEKIEMVLFGDQEHQQNMINAAQEGVIAYGYPASKKAFEDMINADA
jgi:glycosyltransferase involved in cell wall biosynthesis